MQKDKIEKRNKNKMNIEGRKIIFISIFFLIIFFYILQNTISMIAFQVTANIALIIIFLYLIVSIYKYNDSKYINVFTAILVISLSLFILEFSIGNLSLTYSLIRLSPLEIFLNVIIYLFIWLFLSALFRKRSTAFIVMISLAAVLAIAEIYVLKFRGRVILPLDLYAIRTAANVFVKYSFIPSSSQFIILGIYFIVLAAALKWRKSAAEKDKQNSKLLKRATKIFSSILVILILLYSNLLGWLGFQDNLYDSMWNTRLNGVSLNFVVNLKYSKVTVPENYSPEKIAAIIANESDTISSIDDYETPNIIVIMNEAWADLSVIGIESSEDLFADLFSYDENMMHGYTYVSTFGGHTANAEYEFLTGNTMAFTPMETVAYQLYVKEGEYSLVNQMNLMGYETVAMHPYKSSGWNRVVVYDEFGFDEMYFIEDFKEPETIRGYTTDKSNYDKLIEIYENKEEKPLFMFNITMQNHGGYWEKDVFEDMVYAEGYEQDERLSLYLSLIKESNAALFNLLDYFSSQDEPTVVLMFGDHFPGLGDDFYNDYLGASMEELPAEAYNLLYKIPYVLWTNFDFDTSNSYDTISLNYLGAYLLHILDLPMTAFEKFLMEIYKDIPVINRPSYRSVYEEVLSENSIYTPEQINIIKEYEAVQYSGVHDRENRNDNLFFLNPTD